MRIKPILLQFLACLFSVAVCVWLYDLSTDTDTALWPDWWPVEMAILVIISWLAILLFGSEGQRLRTWFDRCFTAIGFMLLTEYGLTYLFYWKPLPWVVLLGGAGMSITLSMLLAGAVHSPEPQAILLLGFDSTARALVPVLRERIVGILDDDPSRVASGLPFLGPYDRLSEAVAEKRPAFVIVSDTGRRPPVTPKQLLRLRYAGITVEPGSAFYESVFSRVNSAALHPFELLFSSAFMASRAAMAVQAVYTNVLALGLVLLLSPLLLLIVVLTWISARGPALERVECPGFEQIPFRLLRFRTLGRHGEKLWIGRWITRLGLVNLPQLVNVVRGEMTLVGPPPVRMEFARRLISLAPVYGHRFTVRPGILGWSQTHLRAIPLPDERLRLEYDLYYVKQGSPSMDLDIMCRTLFRFLMPTPMKRTPGTV
jgi:lipopolysaccharide/colanic/teichoic acid biosynthesis glycosyltransferase